MGVRSSASKTVPFIKGIQIPVVMCQFTRIPMTHLNVSLVLLNFFLSEPTQRLAGIIFIGRFSRLPPLGIMGVQLGASLYPRYHTSLDVGGVSGGLVIGSQ